MAAFLSVPWQARFRLVKHFLSCPMSSPAVAAANAYLASVDLSKYDPEQSRLMQERCILVDESDNAIGAVDKKTCMSAFTCLRFQ